MGFIEIYYIMLCIFYFVSFLEDEFCRGVFPHAFNKQGSETSGNSGETTKLKRNGNGILTQKMLCPRVNGEQETNTKKLFGFVKSL